MVITLKTSGGVGDPIEPDDGTQNISGDLSVSGGVSVGQEITTGGNLNVNDAVILDSSGFIKLAEKSSPPTTIAGFGYTWVQDDAPNTLWFTDDTDVDRQLFFSDGSVSMVSTLSMGTNDIDDAGFITFAERAAAPSISAGFGSLWVRDDAPSSLQYIDDSSGSHPVFMADGSITATGTFDLGTNNLLNVGNLGADTATISPGSASSPSIIGSASNPDVGININSNHVAVCAGGTASSDILQVYSTGVLVNTGVIRPTSSGSADLGRDTVPWGEAHVNTIYARSSSTDSLSITHNGTDGVFDLSTSDATFKFNQAGGTPAATLTSSANSTATDASLANTFELTLTENSTLENPTNLKQGFTYLWYVKQDATGGWTLSFGSLFKWPGGTAPTITSTASAVDLICAYYDGTSLYANFNQDFQ